MILTLSLSELDVAWEPLKPLGPKFDLSKTKLSETGVQSLYFYFLVFENWDDFAFITALGTVSEADATGWEHASAATEERK